jgi:hypothetical protein
MCYLPLLLASRSTVTALWAEALLDALPIPA